MTGVKRAIVVLAVVALVAAAETACATKAVPPNAGEPYAAVLTPNDVPRQVDDLMRDLQSVLLKPVREALRAAPVSTTGPASDGSYTRWMTQVSEAVVSNNPLPKDLEQLSERAYRDLARLCGRPAKRDDASPDLSLLARRLHVFFEKQSAEVRKTAAAYMESAFSIPG